MLTSATKRNDMMVGERRKLAKAEDALMMHDGFKREDDAMCYGWRRRCDKRNADVLAALNIGGHPWLACRFDRDYPHPELPWNHDLNHWPFKAEHDQLGANPCSGKCNCHIFERVTAAEALMQFENHIRLLLGETDSPWLY